MSYSPSKLAVTGAKKKKKKKKREKKLMGVVGWVDSKQLEASLAAMSVPYCSPKIRVTWQLMIL